MYYSPTQINTNIKCTSIKVTMESFYFPAIFFLQYTCDTIVISKVMRKCFHSCLHHVHIRSSQVSLIKDT